MCKQRCFAYISHTARALTQYQEKAFHMNHRVQENMDRDAHVCFLGCCFRSGVNYQKCSEACHRYSYVQKRTLQFRQYHLCTKGCFARCPSMEHEAEDSMEAVAPMDNAGCTTTAPKFGVEVPIVFFQRSNNSTLM